MEPSNNSTFYFHVAPNHYNCAQAVLKSFQKEYALSDETIDEFRAWGGGRAHGGLCGALYAANYLRELKKMPPITEAFCKQIQYSTCKEIKQLGKVSCNECVRVADELLRS